MRTVLELAGDLVRIPSVNPDGDPGTEGVGEKACADFVAAYLRECGAEAWVEDVFPGRPNVVGRFPSDRPGKPRLLFAPHTDTVSVVGMTIDPFSGEVRDGKLWGRGSSDTKGPMAAMLHALRKNRDLIPQLSHEIWFAGLMSEEAGQHGAKALAEKEKFDFAIIGEPTGLQVVRTHKGSVWLTIRARGRAVHGSMPEKGVNAIEGLMEALGFFREEFGRLFGELQDEVLGRPTFNLGLIHGGSKVNIVPDCAEAVIDMRTVPGQEIAPLINAITVRFPAIEIDLKKSEPLWTDSGLPVIKLLGECGAHCAGAPWFCDAAIFSTAGTPAVAIGPGSIVQAHTADEWISVQDLEDGAKFFHNFLQKLQ